MNNFVKENSIESKIVYIEKLRHVLDIIGNPSMSRI